MDVQNLVQQISDGDFKSLARVISLIENNSAYALLQLLPNSNKKIIGITGPPGAGKSTLVDGLINEYINQHLPAGRHGKKIGIICIDPSSAFHHGALLGDRIRMNSWFNNPNVYIRSLSTRGNFGGLHPKIIEITDVMKAAPFDAIIIETVGVGQTETEIAALADTTIVVLVPEAGDDIQTMKAGLMEIANLFVVNKADRPGADKFIKDLKSSFQSNKKNIPVIKTIATEKKGIDELIKQIETHETSIDKNENKLKLLSEKAYQLIQQKRMKNITKSRLEELIKEDYKNSDFNLYKFVENFEKRN